MTNDILLSIHFVLGFIGAVALYAHRFPEFPRRITLLDVFLIGLLTLMGAFIFVYAILARLPSPDEIVLWDSKPKDPS